MNSGRTKYTATPTYGMQKRWFGKRQAEKTSNAKLDFTQKPTPDFDAPISGTPDPYMVPQGIYHNPVPLQENAPLQAYGAPDQGMSGNYALPVQNTGVQGTYPLFAAEPDPPYGGMNQPFTGTPVPQMPPLANTGTAARPISQNARAQGYVPPIIMPAEQTASQPMMQANGMPQGMAFPPQGQAGAMPQGMAFPPQGQAAAMPQGMAFQPQGQPLFSARQPLDQPNGGMGGYPGYPGENQPPIQPPGKRNKLPINIDNWLKMLLYIVLPVVFVLCIALPVEFNILRYLFMTACAASVGMLWYRQSFSASLRTGVTIGYGLMCVIVAVVMFSGSNSDVVKTGANITTQPTPVITDEPADNALGYSADQAPQTTPPTVVAPADTEAGQRLSSFMDYWKLNSIEDMLGYVMPSWKNTQTDAAAALFIIISNRTPLEYEIEEVSGMSGDTSVSVTMTATIDKNNGNDPVRYRFVILMDIEEEDWYVDPKSLSTNDIEKEEPTIAPDNIDAIYTLAPRMTVTPVPPDSTLLYYNPDGGKYYHADPACEAVNAKYLPMASFTYGEINEPPYNSLRPCLKCNAPTN